MKKILCVMLSLLAVFAFIGSAAAAAAGDDIAPLKEIYDQKAAAVKDLEARYNEAKKTEINDMVEAANITPEELASLIRNAKKIRTAIYRKSGKAFVPTAGTCPTQQKC